MSHTVTDNDELTRYCPKLEITKFQLSFGNEKKIQKVLNQRMAKFQARK
jgi:hypothetical protein